MTLRWDSVEGEASRSDERYLFFEADSETNLGFRTFGNLFHWFPRERKFFRVCQLEEARVFLEFEDWKLVKAVLNICPKTVSNSVMKRCTISITISTAHLRLW